MGKVYLIMDTCSQIEDFNADCDYAVAELTPELMNRVAERLEKAHELAKTLPLLECMGYRDYSAEYYSYSSLEPVFETDPEFRRNEFAEWKYAILHDRDGMIEKIDPERTTSDKMLVNGGDVGIGFVYFSAIPKHCDFTVETRALYLEELVSIAEQLKDEEISNRFAKIVEYEKELRNARLGTASGQ